MHLIIYCVDRKYYDGVLEKPTQKIDDPKLKELPDPYPEKEVIRKIEHI